MVALAAVAGSAQAAGITASTITSPSNDSYFYYDSGAASTTLFTVTGTIAGTGNIDINCYDGSGVYYTLAGDVPVTGDTFSVAITTAEVASTVENDTCVLRAVDTGDTGSYPPGTSSIFGGPTVAISEKTAIAPTAGTTTNYLYGFNGFDGFELFEAPGNCGLQGYLYAPGALTPSATSFDCLGSLLDPEPTQSGPAPNGEITVDGVEALDSTAAYNEFGTLPGYQGITLTDSFDATTGVLIVQDDEPILDCVPSYASCTSFSSSGVELDRTWEAEADGRVALQTDVFRSVDGAQHTLAVLEDDAFGSTYPPGGAFMFPGSTSFQDYAENATVALPSGPGTIYYESDSAAPSAGDGTHPQVAVTYSSAPSAPVDFTSSDEAASGQSPEFVLPYNRTIPAGGSVALRFGYVQAYAFSDVQTLAQQTLASFAPTVLIASPANGATVSAAPVTVSGTASDPSGIKSVTVDGHTATVGAGGAFSASVALTPGANTITAVATDEDGVTGQEQISVTYKLGPVAVTGVATRITATRAEVTGALDPEGQATAYLFQYGATTALASYSTPALAGPGTTPLLITATLSALKPGTIYFYRVIAINAGGPSVGATLSFRTAKPAPRGLGAKATPTTATTFPYHYTVKGKLSPPAGVTAKQGCSGRITLAVKRGRKTIYTTHATIGKKCTWKASVTLKDRGKVPGHGKLAITPSFGGNQALATLTAKPLSVRYG